MALIKLLHELFADVVVQILGGHTSLCIGPVEHLLVDFLALSELHVEPIKVRILLSRHDVRRLDALKLDAHRCRTDRGDTQVKLIQLIVLILRDGDVVDEARARYLITIGGHLGVMVREDGARPMEVVVIHKSHLWISQRVKTFDESLEGAFFDPGRALGA